MEAELLTVLPNLSIGVVSIGALVYIAHRFLVHLNERDIRHEVERKETHTTLRELEKEARTSLATTLAQSSQALTQNAQIMDRVVRILDKHQ